MMTLKILLRRKRRSTSLMTPGERETNHLTEIGTNVGAGAETGGKTGVGTEQERRERDHRPGEEDLRQTLHRGREGPLRIHRLEGEEDHHQILHQEREGPPRIHHPGEEEDPHQTLHQEREDHPRIRRPEEEGGHPQTLHQGRGGRVALLEEVPHRLRRSEGWTCWARLTLKLKL